MALRIGQMACLNPRCPTKVTDMPVEQTAAGNWQAKCQRCGCSTFSKLGTQWRRDMEALTTLDTAEAPAAAPAAPPAPAQRGRTMLG